MNPSYRLEDCRRQAKRHPQTFTAPPAAHLAPLKAGSLVQLIFLAASGPNAIGCGGERMWVRITSRDGDDFVGELRNTPATLGGLGFGDEVRFEARHVADIDHSN